jgi:hypothetical protein
MTPPSRWQMTQRSVHTTQPGRPDWVEPPAPGFGRGAGPSSSVEGDGAAGGEGGAAGTSAGDGAVGGAPDGNASEGDCAAGGVAVGADAAGDAEDAGAGASAARAIAVPRQSATARPTVMCAGAWVHEPRGIVASPPSDREPYVRIDGNRARLRRKSVGRVGTDAGPSPQTWRTVPPGNSVPAGANGLGSAATMP